MRVIGLVLALGIVLAPRAAPAQQPERFVDGAVLRWYQDFLPRPRGPLMILAIDAASGRLVPGANTTHVYLGNEYWDVGLASSRGVGDTFEPGYYHVSVVVPGYKETSVRVFSSVLNSRLPLVIRLEKATPSDP